MILVIMYMKVSSKKRKELSQANISLLISIRSEKGCVHCDLFHGVEDENVLCLLQEWDSMKNFEIYRESECHKVLRGAMHLLEEPWEIISCQESETHNKNR